jgi:choline monooxygenase
LDEGYHCLSNVCTHRGNLLNAAPSTSKKLVCGYHGRRFSLDGTFEFMPEFEKAEGFPSECDHLPAFPLWNWGPLWLTALDPAIDFAEIAGIMDERIGFLSPEKFLLAPEQSRSYEIKAHWALYCDNYLEGFHIPFVHKDLDAVLDYGAYETQLFEHCNLQIGYANDETQDVFDLPEGHLDYGKKIAAYYFWVFPNLMFNFYPWGLSLNIVNPVAIDRTQVDFVSYVGNPEKLGKGAGADLDKVELEDEAVVEGVQKGIQSGFYDSGRFSPTREMGVHHFHRLLAQYMNA